MRFASLLIGLWLIYSPAQAANDLNYNQVALRAEASTEVNRERMHVMLYTESQHQDPAKLAAKITQTLNAALEQARKVPNLNISQGNRSSYPIYEKEGQNVTSWRERAELRLESSDFPALARLTAELMQSLNMGNLYFSISEQSRRQHEEALLKQAIAAFRTRAQLTTEALGGTSYKIISLNLNSSTPYMPSPMRTLMMKADRVAAAAPTPEVESGTQTLTLTADGLIEVQMP